MLTHLEQFTARELVKYAAGYKITCPHCDDILDAKGTVVLTDDVTNESDIVCWRCYGHPIGNIKSGRVQIWDGRALWPSKSKNVWRYK